MKLVLCLLAVVFVVGLIGFFIWDERRSKRLEDERHHEEIARRNRNSALNQAYRDGLQAGYSNGVYDSHYRGRDSHGHWLPASEEYKKAVAQAAAQKRADKLRAVEKRKCRHAKRKAD
jgi:flagellar biosynthesis/type III secretory pathway protein FliH